MKIHAVIPARGGSKGLPGKNMLRVGAETLIGQAVRKCLECDRIQKVVVTSDCREIMAEAESYGSTRHGGKVETCLRPPELRGDDVPSCDVLLDVIKHDMCDVLVWVQCTSPLMTAQDIAGTLQAVLESPVDMAVAVHPTDGYRLSGLNGSVSSVGWSMESGFVRRQDRMPLYEVVGSVWAMYGQPFRERKAIWSRNCALYRAQHRRLEIDTAEDLEFARAYMRGLAADSFPVVSYSTDVYVPPGAMD